MRGANDQRLNAVVIFEDTCKCCRHQCLTETNDIADHDAASLVQMMGSNLDCSLLKFEQLVAKVGRDLEFLQSCPRLLRQVIGHLDIDVVRRQDFHPCPTVVDDLH